jgi:WD40 repeat protein
MLSSACLRVLCGAVCFALLSAAPSPAAEPTERITPGNLARLRVIHEIDDDIWEIRWRADGTELAFLHWEQPVQILDPATLKVRGTVAEGRRIIHFAFGKDLDVHAFCENSSSLHLVSAQATEPIELETRNSQPQMAFSPDGKLLAAGGYGTVARVWTVPDARLVHELDVGPAEGGLTPGFSPDSRLLVVGNRNAETCVFDVETGERRFLLPLRMTHGFRFDPTGQTLAVAYVDADLALWSMESGQLIRRVKAAATELYRADWSPAGDLLVTSGLGGRITFWDPRDLTLLRELDSPEWVIECQFSPDGTRLFTAGGGSNPGAARKVRVWGGSAINSLDSPR